MIVMVIVEFFTSCFFLLFQRLYSKMNEMTWIYSTKYIQNE